MHRWSNCHIRIWLFRTLDGFGEVRSNDAAHTSNCTSIIHSLALLLVRWQVGYRLRVVLHVSGKWTCVVLPGERHLGHRVFRMHHVRWVVAVRIHVLPIQFFKFHFWFLFLFSRLFDGCQLFERGASVFEWVDFIWLFVVVILVWVLEVYTGGRVFWGQNFDVWI